MDIFPMCRLNDMWTISLQDREHACWEEASIITFSIYNIESRTHTNTVCDNVSVSAFVSIRSIRVVRFLHLAATSL